jgi:hypothetical protein
MRSALIVALLTVFCGCTTVQLPNYIKSDRPYVRKYYGDIEQINAVVRNVLVHNGWKIKSEARPSVYERPSDGQNTEKDVLLFTNVKQHPMILYSSYTHLNVLIHAIAEGAEVEIRYHKVTPLLIKQFNSTRNDKLVNGLLEAIEQALVEGK